MTVVGGPCRSFVRMRRSRYSLRLWFWYDFCNWTRSYICSTADLPTGCRRAVKWALNSSRIIRFVTLDSDGRCRIGSVSGPGKMDVTRVDHPDSEWYPARAQSHLDLPPQTATDINSRERVGVHHMATWCMASTRSGITMALVMGVRVGEDKQGRSVCHGVPSYYLPASWVIHGLTHTVPRDRSSLVSSPTDYVFRGDRLTHTVPHNSVVSSQGNRHPKWRPTKESVLNRADRNTLFRPM